MPEIFDTPDQLPPDLLDSCAEVEPPRTALMCPPVYFDVTEVRNVHMEAHLGHVDFELARKQWEQVRDAIADCGVTVELIEPVELAEDMVFCANQTLVGPDAYGQKLCLLSQMRFPARQREVPAFERWFSQHGYQVEQLPGEEIFEGSGDAIWHPGRALLWGGYGLRTEPDAYEAISDFFGVPVIRMQLQSDAFYHLDMCFCALDEQTALVYPAGLTDEALSMIEAVFDDVIDCSEEEALDGFACNAAAFPDGHVVIQRDNAGVRQALSARDFFVHEVDTSEFMKSGGSVFCMKMYVF